MDKPLPCPFCGGVACLTATMPGNCRWFQCGDCHSKGRWHYTEAEALAEWNRRSADAVLAWIAEQSSGVIGNIQDAIRERRIALDVCEHGLADTEYCEPCNREYKRARAEHGDED